MDQDLIISVIIPVYNGEKFVRRAVESVLCQMDGRVELILVDDGSTDNSGSKCDEYSKRYPLVQVVHKKNGGLSSARNAGLAVSKGAYIVFLDVDDYLEPHTCKELISVIEEYHPDCIDFGWKYVSSSGIITENLHKLPKKELLGGEVLRNTIIPPVLNLCADADHFIFDFAWNKVYRRDIIESNSVFFDEGRRIWEDRPFVAHYLKYCRSFYSMDQCYYNYVDVDGSLSRQYSMEFFEVIIANYQHFRRLYDAEYDFDTQFVNAYWCHSIEKMIFRSLQQGGNNAAVESCILAALQHEQVIRWFGSRIPTNEFEKKLSNLITSGKQEKALHCCKKQAAKKRRSELLTNMKGYMKRGFCKIIGR